ncbi:hypothetical protein BS47DRAFT_1364009 [Hydnum rufescens UP504]|uniref:Uncharacterized protein n=1 Tax=Hydnum rufescens UP504 TaxID=1448309 RepID=A0A9P6DU10_9AGAM|nr:hypothetical protein BS47DRAFT_1364009 [Hydnum rufescens UP504]
MPIPRTLFWHAGLLALPCFFFVHDVVNSIFAQGDRTSLMISEMFDPLEVKRCLDFEHRSLTPKGEGTSRQAPLSGRLHLIQRTHAGWHDLLSPTGPRLWFRELLNLAVEIQDDEHGFRPWKRATIKSFTKILGDLACRIVPWEHYGNPLLFLNFQVLIEGK